MNVECCMKNYEFAYTLCKLVKKFFISSINQKKSKKKSQKIKSTANFLFLGTFFSSKKKNQYM